MSQLIFSILLGAIGGNIVMAVLRNLNLGLLRNTVIGAFGGYIGFSILGDLSFTPRLGVVLGLGFVLGAGLTAVVGALMNLRSR